MTRGTIGNEEPNLQYPRPAEAGALDDLELFADWSTATEVARLKTDKRFEALRGNPWFDRILGVDN